MNDYSELESYMSDVISDVAMKFDSLMEYVEEDEIRGAIETARGGKKLRPVLTLLVSDNFGGDRDTAICFGVSIELAHQASLMHDDVIDSDMFRRGKPSVQNLFGADIAIAGGDILVSFVMTSIQNIAPHHFVFASPILGETYRGLSQGAVYEVKNCKIPDENIYNRIVKYKTGLLFQSSAELGYVSAFNPMFFLNRGPQKLAKEYGLLTGIAFQTTDDITDFTNTIKSGKPVGDVRTARATLPIILAKNMNIPVDDYLNDKLNDEQKIEFIKKLESEGVIKKSFEVRDNYIKKAEHIAKGFKNNKYQKLLIQYPRYCCSMLEHE